MSILTIILSIILIGAWSVGWARYVKAKQKTRDYDWEWNKNTFFAGILVGGSFAIFLAILIVEQFVPMLCIAAFLGTCYGVYRLFDKAYDRFIGD